MSTQFVVGAPRTGSTLLVKTLNTLEDMRCQCGLLGEDKVRSDEYGVDLISAGSSQRLCRHF
jgi:hypothetical protein